jgi:CRP-like cAMP-binding protein
VNREAISLIPFLKNRDHQFYLDYLNKLSPMRFDQSDTIFNVGQVPREVYFILKGTVLNTSTNRCFGQGYMFGHEDILYDRKRDSHCKAETELFTLRLERETFEKMVETTPNLR